MNRLTMSRGGAPKPAGGFRPSKASPRPRQRRLYGAHGGAQHSRGLLERQVQDILHENGGALLRMKSLEQRPGRYAAVCRLEGRDRKPASARSRTIAACSRADRRIRSIQNSPPCESGTPSDSPAWCRSFPRG